MPNRQASMVACKKKEGRPLPHGKSPGAPNSTSSGAGSSRFAETTFLGETYSRNRPVPVDKRKGTRPDGCLRNRDTRAALRLPDMSAFLASC